MLRNKVISYLPVVRIAYLIFGVIVILICGLALLLTRLIIRLSGPLELRITLLFAMLMAGLVVVASIGVLFVTARIIHLIAEIADPLIETWHRGVYDVLNVVALLLRVYNIVTLL